MSRVIKEKIRRYIKSGAVDKTVNAEKQSRHYHNSDGYVPGRSYLLEGIDAQRLVDEYHGTGEVKFTKAGKWKNKEVVDADIDVGMCVNPDTEKEAVTNSFTIHYSLTGTHVIPAPRKE